MGKSNKSNNKRSSYTHNHTYNPRAHESNDRKLKLSKNLEIKRCLNILNKIKTNLTNYLPVDEIKRQNTPMDPKYKLKGGASVAQQYYLPSDYRPPMESIDVFDEYDGRLYDHEEGIKYMIAMKDYGVALHNVGNKTRESIEIFQEMLVLDRNDNLNAKEHLLRCYMSNALGDKARELIDQYPNHKSNMFLYTLSLLDYISVLIEEEGSSITIANQSLSNAISCNKYILYLLAYHNQFDLSNLSINTDSYVSNDELLLQDAIIYFQNDHILWVETDNAITWLLDYIVTNKMLESLKNDFKLIEFSTINTDSYMNTFINTINTIN